MLTPIDAESLKVITKNLKSFAYKYYQFYNLELEANEYGFIQHMLTYKDNPRPKVLNKTYYDIETYVNEAGDFTDPEKVEEAINAIAVYNNFSNTAYVIAFVTDCDITDPVVISDGVHKMFNEKVAENEAYNIPDIKIEVIITANEKELLQTFFEIIRNENTLALVGFNSSIFDDPYIFNRTSKLFGEHAMKEMASEFGIVDKFGNSSFELPDYILVDLLKLYKPVGVGGGGLGKSLPDFKLNTVAKKELKITKLDLESGFRETYLHNIIGYLTYNIFDTILTFKLDQKLTFMELMMDLAKYNNSTMGATINGRSLIYMYRNDLMYASQNKLVRSKKFSSEVLFATEIQKGD